MTVCINHEKLLNPVLMEQLLGRLHLNALADRNQLFGHQFRDRLGWVVGETHIAVRDDTHELAVFARYHGNSGNRFPVHDRQRIGQGLIGGGW